ncbi:SDR family NAD(P)-dependent oxidoreductase [Rhodococcus sp. AW25M09]|uniref:SDR family NAD(P)-dependent oxidoreductase n=1 Tax=Rhodococcus sp. AW25M09 TaxID=1268303 RepID=UPI000344F088|nr:SDR family NAD(P)-dependent oxidoreductase [Rhodococcus sp. AW25M09]
MTVRSLSGQVLVVTGAAGGIGSATAIECSARGADVVLLDVNVAGLARVVATMPVLRGALTTTPFTARSRAVAPAIRRLSNRHVTRS